MLSKCERSYVVCRHRIRRRVAKLRRQFECQLQYIGDSSSRALNYVRLARALSTPVLRPLQKSQIVSMNLEERYRLGQVMEDSERHL